MKNFGYNQAVRVGDRIECSGQGGWNPETGEFYQDLDEQIDQAFKNVDINLRDAGGQGWSQVYKISSFHVPLDMEAAGAMIRNFAKWMPNHKPIWTAIGVAGLGGTTEMKVEIEVIAHDEQGAKAAKGGQ
ncbi:hypothetical protein B0A52_09926 [Exophiala mesophila]|uniref:Uncharacterized protein n=1 Tax=Exophiala mesophila TaxID=212818 RepID=A0A438MQU0_EXOME|nr:hypothetical protein B0A52_09926 [Exophiala mesophila]